MARKPMERLKAVQCDGKNPYETKAKAKTAIRRMKGRRKRMSAYRCPHCNYFHIGGEK